MRSNVLSACMPARGNRLPLPRAATRKSMRKGNGSAPRTDSLVARACSDRRRSRASRAIEDLAGGRSGKLPPNATVRDYVNTAGSALLAPHFADKSPEYPIFSVLVTRQNRDQAAQEALRWIAGGVKSKQGSAILDALELLDGETLKPRNLRYGQETCSTL